MNQTDTNICEKIDIKPFAYAVSLFNGKWKMHILFWLWKKRSHALQRNQAGVRKGNP